MRCPRLGSSANNSRKCSLETVLWCDVRAFHADCLVALFFACGLGLATILISFSFLPLCKSGDLAVSCRYDSDKQLARDRRRLEVVESVSHNFTMLRAAVILCVSPGARATDASKILQASIQRNCVHSPSPKSANRPAPSRQGLHTTVVSELVFFSPT